MARRKLKQTRKCIMARSKYQRRKMTTGAGIRRKGRKPGKGKRKGIKHEKGGWLMTALTLLPIVMDLFSDD